MREMTVSRMAKGTYEEQTTCARLKDMPRLLNDQMSR